MKFFPKPPTDNLYKFLAITGIWLIAFVTIYFMYIGYLNLELRKLTNQSLEVMFSKNIVQEIDDRLASIENDKLKENIIDWMPISDGSAKEVAFLNNFKKGHVETIEKFDTRPIKDYEYQLELNEALGVKVYAFILLFSSSIFFLLGFKGWYSKVQKPVDLSLELDAKLKKLSIQKLESELALTKKSSRTRFTRR